MPKITIIVPVYNQEQYIRECLDSIINQTLEDIEVICVNDCSTDSSLSILEEYAQKDNRIKIFSQEKNLGTGLARNIAIDASEGEYIMFVDPDDYIELKACEILYNNAKSYDSDFVEFLFDRFDKEKNFYTIEKLYDLPNNGLIDKELILKSNIFSAPIMAWNKFYKSDFLKTNKIYFHNSRLAEDHIVTIKTRCLANRITYLNSVLYHYRINPANNQATDIGNLPEIFKEIKDFLVKENIFNSVYRNYYNYYNKSLSLLKIGNKKDYKNKCLFNTSNTTKYDKIIPLGYNCQVSFALKKLYGDNAIESNFFNWIYISDQNKLVQYLYEPNLLLAKGLEFDEKSFMYTDLSLGFRYHTKRDHKDFYNSDETLNDNFIEHDKTDVSSRMSYLAKKFRTTLSSNSKNLYVLCFKSNVEYENAPIIIEKISKFFEQNSGNKKSKVLCIFENEYLKHINLKQYDNIIYQSITEFPPDAFADCTNIYDWAQIFQNIVFTNNKIIWHQIFSAKNKYSNGIKHKVITILGIKIKFKCFHSNKKY